MININKKINWIILITSLLFFIFTTILVLNSFTITKKVDTSISHWSKNIHSPTLDDIMLSITKIGNPYESLIIFLMLSIILISKRKKIPFYIFTVATNLGTVLPELIKNITERIRPESFYLQETSFSFPSGHATISVVFLLSSFLLFAPIIKNKFSRILFLIISVVIFPTVALSRIYLSVHWTTDVIAGVFLGIFCFYFANLICCHKK